MNDGKTIKYKNKYFDFVFRRIVPFIIIIFAIYVIYDPVLDFVKKDYQNTEGVFKQLSAPKNNLLAEQVHFENDSHTYEFPKKFLGKIKLEKGKKYVFTYTKRTRLIIDIKESN